MHLTSSHDRLGAPIPPSSRFAAASLVFGGLLLVFGLDRATDVTPVQHLYYLPIIFAGVRFGMPGGIGAALVAIALYHAANPHLLTFKYEESDLVQIVLFLATGPIVRSQTGDDGACCARGSSLDRAARPRCGPLEVTERPIRTLDRGGSRAHGRPRHR